MVARQFYDREECLTAPLSHDLIFHKMLPLVVGIRQVPVLHFRRPTCVIYSDASYEISDPFPARLGLVYFDDSGSTPLGLAAVVSHTELSALQCRMQQITACEMMPVLYFLLSHSSLVAGRDVLWWIDNQASVSLLIKGSSSQQDLAAISAAVHLYSAHLGCRLWFEWIPTDLNCSDGLSRDGVTDAWTIAQGWNLHTWQLPACLSLVCSSLVRFVETTCRGATNRL